MTVRLPAFDRLPSRSPLVQLIADPAMRTEIVAGSVNTAEGRADGGGLLTTMHSLPPLRDYEAPESFVKFCKSSHNW